MSRFLLHSVLDYRIILYMESAMDTTNLEATTETTAVVMFHECQHCGELTEQHPDLVGTVAYHDAAECVGGTERFTH